MKGSLLVASAPELPERTKILLMQLRE